MEPLSDRERDIMIMQKYGEIPRRRQLPMSATIYDDEEEDPNSIWGWDYLEEDENGDY